MALIVRSVRWAPDEKRESGRRFIIELEAESEDDVPDIPFSCVWDKWPVRLTAEPPEPA
jgi:hypothetical protein